MKNTTLRFFLALIWLLAALLLAVSFLACSENGENIGTVEYSIETELHVPDSLRDQYRAFVTETVRAASQNMYGGDYEDADETIDQAEDTGKRIFGKKEVCLKIRYDQYNFRTVRQSEMTQQQRAIFNQLLNDEVMP